MTEDRRHHPEEMAYDELGAISSVFCLFPSLIYFFIVRSQFAQIEQDTYRVQVLSTRVALCLPLYAILLYIALLDAEAYEALMVVVTVIEGYAFYCFFSLLVINMGGPTETVRAMKQDNNTLCCIKMCCAPCSCCCPKDITKFYNQASMLIWHFMITRSIVICFGAVCFYTGTTVGHALYVVSALVGFVMLVSALLSLVNLYENIYKYCLNINGVGKLLLLKVSVGTITGLGIVETLIVAFGGSVTPPDSNDDDEADMTQRAYAFLMLLIMCVLSLFSYNFFTAKMTVPRILYNTSEISEVEFKVSMNKFVCDMLSFRDVYGIIRLKDEPLIDNDTLVNKDGNWL